MSGVMNRLCVTRVGDSASSVAVTAAGSTPLATRRAVTHPTSTTRMPSATVRLRWTMTELVVGSYETPIKVLTGARSASPGIQPSSGPSR